MSTSQNGWPVDQTGARQDRGLYGGVSLPNGVLAGDVAIVARYVCEQYDRTVEPLRQGWCWGWYVKPIEGSTAVSNHASGTAWDLNAPKHPLGVRNTFTPAQRTAIRAILAYCGNVVRWGGDYTGRADEMHFEIIGSPAAVARIARKIEGKLPVDQDDFNALMNGWAASDGGKAAIRRAVWDHREDNAATGTRPLAPALEDTVRMGAVMRSLIPRVEDAADAVVDQLKPAPAL